MKLSSLQTNSSVQKHDIPNSVNASDKAIEVLVTFLLLYEYLMISTQDMESKD